MPQLASLVARASASWEPLVERAVFDTTDPEEVATRVTNLVTLVLGRSVADAVFYRPGVGWSRAFASPTGPRW